MFNQLEMQPWDQAGREALQASIDRDPQTVAAATGSLAVHEAHVWFAVHMPWAGTD